MSEVEEFRSAMQKRLSPLPEGLRAIGLQFSKCEVMPADEELGIDEGIVVVDLLNSQSQVGFSFMVGTTGQVGGPALEDMKQETEAGFADLEEYFVQGGRSDDADELVTSMEDFDTFWSHIQTLLTGELADIIQGRRWQVVELDGLE